MRSTSRDRSSVMGPCRRGSVVVVVLAVFLTSMRVARAEDAAQAKKDFLEGVRLFQRGDVQGARAMFLKADDEKHSPAIVYNLGRVEEQLGHPQAAVDAYEAYIGELGETGEFSQAAAVAVAQLKKRSVKLRVTSSPVGARIFIDAAPLKEPTPTSVLVVPGTHHVAVSWSLGGTHWQDESDVSAKEIGGTQQIALSAPKDWQSTSLPVAPSPALAPGPDGFLWGANFETYFGYFFENASHPEPNRGAARFLAGVSATVGYAVSDRFEVLLRGFAAIGSDGTPPGYAWGVGPAISARAGKDVWLGLGLFGGRAYACRGRCPTGESVTVDGLQWQTDLVFGPQLEFSYVVARRDYGEWLVSVKPGMYFANAWPFGDQDHHFLFFPVGLGLRSF